MFLENINDTKDIKKIKKEDLHILADEVRKTLINKLSKAGGHNGPNLGVVELTIALHYVFDSPNDKIVFDVSHQCYPHKMLTGRKQAFMDANHFHDVTGYTNPEESKHDIFKVGHTSTSVSLALGLAVGRDLNNRKENIIALIGDGSLSGGEALEGLDYAGEYKKNLIIVVNDNDQSIAENHGGLYKTLKELRDSNGKSENNFFKSLGLDYRYLEDGHDVEKLVDLFESVKDIDHPIVLHIHTIKGKGLSYAENNREAWHAGGPFNVTDGSREVEATGDDTVFRSIKELLDNNKKAIVVNAATPMVCGFVKGVREKYVEQGQFIDVGIAEENAMCMVSGIARNGGTPIFITYAPFFQRSYDQVSHDLCLNDNPATFMVVGPGVYGMNDDTHIALCDIQMFAHIPNLIYLAPSTREEYENAFKFATTQKEHPVGIRVPSIFSNMSKIDETDFSKLENKVYLKGKDIAIFAVSKMVDIAMEVAKKIKNEKGLDITVINPLVLSSLDCNLLEKLKLDHKLIVTIEDGELMGGYGQNIASYYSDTNILVKNFGITKKFHSEFVAEKLLDENGMSVDKLYNYIISRI